MLRRATCGKWPAPIESPSPSPPATSTVRRGLPSFTPTAVGTREGTLTDGVWFFNTNPITEPQEGRGEGMPFYPGLDAVGQRTEGYFHLFPTTLFEIWPDQRAIFQLHALEPGRTIEHIHLYFIGEGATEAQYEPNRQAVYDMWDELNTEDFTIVENMQMARSSPAFDGGVLVEVGII